MELSLYNAVMTGMACDGRSFTYENQLASCDSSLSRRYDWFACPCCPPNFSRILASIGGYLWSHSFGADKGLKIAVHMYGMATIKIPTPAGEATLKQISEWPWSGLVQFELDGPNEAAVSVAIRIPSWAKSWTVSHIFRKPFMVRLTVFRLPLKYRTSRSKKDTHICRHHTSKITEALNSTSTCTSGRSLLTHSQT
jgi:hypothetical protein